MFGLISQSNLRGIFLTHPLAFTFLGKSSPANLTYVFNQIEINDFSFLSKDSLIFHRPKPVLDKKSKSVFLCTNGLLNGSSFLLNFNEGGGGGIGASLGKWWSSWHHWQPVSSTTRLQLCWLLSIERHFFALCQIGQSNMVLKNETAYTYTMECKKKENMKQRFSCCGKSTGKGSKQNGKKLISN